jgi:hypothetical protein
VIPLPQAKPTRPGLRGRLPSSPTARSTAIVDEHEARRWCEQLAKLVELRAIDRNGQPYLDRYHLAGWHPGRRGPSVPALYLHHFVASDSDDEVHSHPWGWSMSLILAGGYLEERCDRDGRRSERELRAGDLNVIGPDDRHRIELLDGDCWTLFLAGTFLRPWEFYPRC